MSNSKIIFRSLAHAVGVVVYVLFINLFFSNAEKIFGKEDPALVPMAMLLLFVFSAALTGALVLGKPILLYLDNQKNDAIKMFLYTTGWIFVFIIIVFTVMMLTK